MDIETFHGSMGSQVCKATLGCIYSHYFREKPHHGSDSQERSNINTVFGEVARILGYPSWECMPMEEVTIPLVRKAYHNIYNRKRYSGVGKAMDEDFITCARMFSIFGIPDGDNTFYQMRLEYKPSARPPKKQWASPPRKSVGGKVCRKIVRKTRLGPQGPGLGLQPHKPEFPQFLGEVNYNRRIVCISGVRVTSTVIGNKQ